MQPQAPLSAILGNSSPLLSVEWQGKKYTARLINQIVKQQIEETLYNRRMRPILEMGGRLPPGLVREMIDQFSREYMLGKYGMFSEYGQEFLKTVEGNTLLVALVFEVDQMQGLQLLSEKSLEVQAILSRVISMSFPMADTDSPPV